MNEKCPKCGWVVYHTQSVWCEDMVVCPKCGWTKTTCEPRKQLAQKNDEIKSLREIVNRCGEAQARIDHVLALMEDHRFKRPTPRVSYPNPDKDMSEWVDKERQLNHEYAKAYSEREIVFREALKERKMARKLTPKQWKKKCDKLWSKIIRSAGRCAVCGKSNCQLHAHHLIHRRAIFFRHNLENGICLCPSCHEFNFGQVADGVEQISAHGTPAAFESWMKANLPDQYAWWEKNRHKVITGLKIDYEAVYNQLAGE